MLSRCPSAFPFVLQSLLLFMQLFLGASLVYVEHRHAGTEASGDNSTSDTIERSQQVQLKKSSMQLGSETRKKVIMKYVFIFKRITLHFKKNSESHNLTCHEIVITYPFDKKMHHVYGKNKILFTMTRCTHVGALIQNMSIVRICFFKYVQLTLHRWLFSLTSTV